MNKILRSLLLQSPKTYQLIYNIKNRYLINFYFNKVQEPDFNALKLICDERSQLFLDVGANAGMSALSIFTLKPNAKVISFEPNPINYPYLDKLVDKFSDFQYMPVGLGDKSTSIDFYYPIYNGKKMTTLGSCNYAQAKGWLNTNTVYWFDANKLEVEKITVEIKTLDSFQLKPEFIKIDVEGFEYEVLLGSQKTLENHRPILLIEGVDLGDKVYQQLQEWEYNCYKFDNNKFYLDKFDCVNNFFIPQEKIELIQPYCGKDSSRKVALEI